MIATEAAGTGGLAAGVLVAGATGLAADCVVCAKAPLATTAAIRKPNANVFMGFARRPWEQPPARDYS